MHACMRTSGVCIDGKADQVVNAILKSLEPSAFPSLYMHKQSTKKFDVRIVAGSA